MEKVSWPDRDGVCVLATAVISLADQVGKTIVRGRLVGLVECVNQQIAESVKNAKKTYLRKYQDFSSILLWGANVVDRVDLLREDQPILVGLKNLLVGEWVIIYGRKSEAGSEEGAREVRLDLC